jgi:signal transduction histidine kinase
MITLIPSLTIYNLPVLIAAVLNIALIAFVGLRRSWEPIHRVFVAWNLALAFWNLGATGIYGSVSESAALWWSRFCCVGIVWIPATFLHLVLLLQDRRTPLQERLLHGVYALGGLLFALNFVRPTLLTERAVPRFWGWAPLGGPATALLDPLIAGTAIYALALLRSAARHARDVRRNQLQYIYGATLIAFLGGGVNLLAIHGAKIYPFGNLLNSLYALIVAYAIVEHGLMDIQLVLRRGAVYGLLSGGLTVVYLTIVAFLQRLFGHYGVRESVVFYTAAFPITVILAPAMKNRIEPFVDHTLFRIGPGRPPSVSSRHDMALMGVLATELAHELAKPLTHIMNEGERLGHGAKGASKQSLSKIKKEAQRAAEILDGFALLSPDRPLHRIAHPLQDLLEESLEALGTQDDPRLRVERHYGVCPPAFVNPGQMAQVFTNVIQNAWQAMPEGGRLRLSLEATLFQGQPAVETAIEDTGPTVPAEILEKVFEPFFTTKRAQGGRGVGLTISRAIVERHGGRMIMESPVGPRGGTRVRITVPVGRKENTHAA